MQEALHRLVRDDTTIAGLLTADNEVRIYWTQAPQGVPKPFVTLLTVSKVPDMHITGPSGLEFARVQIDCYATTYGGSLAVARAIDAALLGYSGTKHDTYFGGIFRADWRESYEHDATPERLYRQSLDYEIWHRGV